MLRKWKLCLVGIGILSSILVTAQTPDYQGNIVKTQQWLDGVVLSDGAIKSQDYISPYFGNLAAIGWTKTPSDYSRIQNWMRWYIAHLNSTDVWNLGYTIYDYNIDASGNEISRNSADSTDSYAATFLSLAWAYYQTGDASAQSYVASIKTQLQNIETVIAKTTDTDGLTWSQLHSNPSIDAKYTMDNSEVYGGLRDAASLMQALGDPTTANSYSSAAASSQQAILNNLWDSAHNQWYWAKSRGGGLSQANTTNWYPDATAQLFPVTYGVVVPTDSKATLSYTAFNNGQPTWDTLQFNDSFPWVVTAYGAAVMGDTGRVNTYINTVQNQIVNAGFPSTSNWYDAEAGWFIRLNARYVNAPGDLSDVTWSCVGSCSSSTVATTNQLDGAAAKMQYTGGTAFSDAIWSNPLSGDYSSQSQFTYSIWAMMSQQTLSQAFEFHVNQYINGQQYPFQIQCDIKGSHLWRVWSPPTGSWISTTAACTAPPANTWVQYVFHFERVSGQLHYQDMVLNGTTYIFDKYANPVTDSTANSVKLRVRLVGDSVGDAYAMWVDKVTLQ